MTFAQEIHAAATTVRERPPLGQALADVLDAAADGMDTFGHLDHRVLRLARHINALHALEAPNG